MREIKFKYGYSDGVNIFEKSFTLDEIEQCLQFDEVSDSPLLRNYKIIYKREYTGLKDKNGVEIYEGDIVKDGSRLWKIEISPIYGIFFILSKGGHTRCYGDFASYLVDDFQVIGNIYEQSCLLDNNS